MKKQKKKKVLDILTHPNKWIKGEEEKNGRCCLIGAVDKIYRGSERERVVQKLIKIIEKHPKNPFDSFDTLVPYSYSKENIITLFNDNVLVNFKDVREVIEKANI